MQVGACMIHNTYIYLAEGTTEDKTPQAVKTAAVKACQSIITEDTGDI